MIRRGRSGGSRSSRTPPGRGSARWRSALDHALPGHIRDDAFRLAVVRGDVFTIVWWATAMSKAASELAAMRTFLGQRKAETLAADPAFAKARRPAVGRTRQRGGDDRGALRRSLGSHCHGRRGRRDWAAREHDHLGRASPPATPTRRARGHPARVARHASTFSQAPSAVPQRGRPPETSSATGPPRNAIFLAPRHQPAQGQAVDARAASARRPSRSGEFSGIRFPHMRRRRKRRAGPRA